MPEHPMAICAEGSARSPISSQGDDSGTLPPANILPPKVKVYSAAPHQSTQKRHSAAPLIKTRGPNLRTCICAEGSARSPLHHTGLCASDDGSPQVDRGCEAITMVGVNTATHTLARFRTTASTPHLYSQVCGALPFRCYLRRLDLRQQLPNTAALARVEVQWQGQLINTGRRKLLQHAALLPAAFWHLEVSACSSELQQVCVQQGKLLALLRSKPPPCQLTLPWLEGPVQVVGLALQKLVMAAP